MEKLNFNNSQLGYYLSGLIEGSGSIWVPEELRSSKGYIQYPTIVFTYNKKEKPFYIHLKEVLGTGNIKELDSSNICKYYINDKNKVIEIINLINGKFRTPKINYLHNAIDSLNLITKTKIDKLPLYNSNLDCNAWLAGMSDSRGGFSVYLRENNLLVKDSTKKVICSFSIILKYKDSSIGLSCLPFMTEIADFFGCKLYCGTEDSLVFRSSMNDKCKLVKSYFDKHSLMTSKYLDYLSYIQGNNYLNKLLTNKDLIEIQTLNDSMISKRIHFNWDHLQNFYK
jgi:hypothetical protein